MSYGIGIVVPKCDIKKEKIRFAYCDWTLPITNKIHPEECKANFIRWYEEFETETKTTTLEKLMTAPCDCVCIVDKLGNFEEMQREWKDVSHSLDCESYILNK